MEKYLFAEELAERGDSRIVCEERMLFNVEFERDSF